MAIVIEWLSLLVSSTFVKALLQRVFIALGISAVTYTGMSAAVSAIGASITSNWGAVSGFALQFLQLAHVPQAMNVIWSALVGSLALRGLTSAGSISKLVFNKSSGNVF